LALATSLAVTASAGLVQNKSKTKADPNFAKDVAPLITKKCLTCHKGKGSPAGVDLSKFKTQSDAQKDTATWERVATAVSAGIMPPKSSPSLTKAQRETIKSWVDKLVASDCRLADPGKVTIRRLNREEYNNTVRDLLGLDVRPADDFPSDDVGNGFDNIGDVLSISPLLMEKYLGAAEQLSKAAIKLPVENQALYQAEEYGTGRGEYAALTTRGEVAFIHDFKPGIYRIKVRAFEDQAGPENAKMLVSVNGEPVQEFQVTARRTAPTLYEMPYRAQSGKWKVAVEFLNDFYQPNNPPANRDRNLWIDYIEIVGPIGGNAGLPESHRRIIPTDPPAGKEREFAQRYLRAFATRAYRRPVSSEELERLMAIFDLAKKYKEPFERGMQLGVQAVLVSPNFLFRAEIDPKVNPGAARSLNGYELATRLSYFLWSSMPDARLMMLAGDGSLAKPEVLKSEVRRMLRDRKTIALADNFAEQWLTLRKLEIIVPDPQRFPDFNAELKSAMKEETKRFFSYVVANDRSILDFLDGKYTFINGTLAKHYGIANVQGSEFRKVSLEGTQRAGVLTQGSILTVTSNPTRTSPTKRGRWVLEQILGTPPPPPPPGADVFATDGKVASAVTLREKMLFHRQKPECASCHQKMDPLGFGLENFDAVGAWRTKDGDAPIDASGELPTGEKFAGPTQLRNLLLKDKHQFVHAFSEKMLTYALGRGLATADRCHVDSITKQVEKSKYTFSSLIESIVMSDPFRKRRTSQ
jgi:hypothetical protein